MKMTYEEYKQKRKAIEPQYKLLVDELVDLLFQATTWPMCDSQELMAIFLKEHEMKTNGPKVPSNFCKED